MSSVASSNTPETGSGIRYDQFTNEISSNDSNQRNNLGAYFSSIYCYTYSKCQRKYQSMQSWCTEDKNKFKTSVYINYALMISNLVFVIIVIYFQNQEKVLQQKISSFDSNKTSKI